MAKYRKDHVKVLQVLGAELPKKTSMKTSDIVAKGFKSADDGDRRVRNAYRMLRKNKHVEIGDRGEYRLTVAGATLYTELAKTGFKVQESEKTDTKKVVKAASKVAAKPASKPASKPAIKPVLKVDKKTEVKKGAKPAVKEVRAPVKPAIKPTKSPIKVVSKAAPPKSNGKTTITAADVKTEVEDTSSSAQLSF